MGHLRERLWDWVFTATIAATFVVALAWIVILLIDLP